MTYSNPTQQYGTLGVNEYSLGKNVKKQHNNAMHEKRQADVKVKKLSSSCISWVVPGF